MAHCMHSQNSPGLRKPSCSLHPQGCTVSLMLPLTGLFIVHWLFLLVEQTHPSFPWTHQQPLPADQSAPLQHPLQTRYLPPNYPPFTLSYLQWTPHNSWEQWTDANSSPGSDELLHVPVPGLINCLPLGQVWQMLVWTHILQRELRDPGKGEGSIPQDTCNCLPCKGADVLM